MRTIIRRAALTAVTLTAALAAPAAADAYSGSFQTPTGNIVCQYATGYSGYMACDVNSARVTYQMSRRGYPRVYGMGPALRGDWTLRYGRKVTVGSFSCTSRYDGLTCRNRGGHGFFVAVQARYRW
ncbi:hypothetical protein DSM112329_02175 [Paraconexibacter sp. AEG42_29]|uniref:Uncharacterized protein n=1 Tax=Paraconexibacter sp. AEG42_29 TaxID=2997339 RepID=A0AAU7AUE6_9ACTN